MFEPTKKKWQTEMVSQCIGMLHTNVLPLQHAFTEIHVTFATYVCHESLNAPVWFHIKTKSACTEGSRHFGE